MKKTALLLMFLLVVSAGSAYAGGVSVKDSLVLDRWTLSIGGFLAGLSTDLRVDNPLDPDQGTDINLEDDLGFSSSETVPRLRLEFILGKRHQISGGYYKTERDSITTLTKEIEWGDETFPINIDVGAFYDTEFLDVAYTYWFYSSEKTALGVTGGLVLANLGSGIGVVLIGQEVEFSQDISTDIPVPQLGFSANTYLGKRFVFVGTLGYIAFSLDDWEGDVSTFVVGVEHRTWENFGFGLGYGFTDYNIDGVGLDLLGKFKYEISGFQIFFRAAW